ncbi:hypothetical protein PV325_007999 [Microctonus aethiopoides]|uniref:Uncharacterized protein n=1 Tax=Microctonus aethiopoides TaxID=144406 RepID=A0AA39FA08_9HYME|nr:hypothetical protein PV325_007999 [Microctonus aethiopoides]KAK0165707.1 hypothetical protein PV328_004206 [Microctonus aethiopoides]
MDIRSKRSLVDKVPYQLHIYMKYSTADTECVVFVKTDQKIANHNLPETALENYNISSLIGNGRYRRVCDVLECGEIFCDCILWKTGSYLDTIVVPQNLPMNKDEGSYGNDQNKEQMMNTQVQVRDPIAFKKIVTGGISDKEDGAKRFPESKFSAFLPSI